MKEVWKDLEEKAMNFTDEGRRRKARICKKALFEGVKLLEFNFNMAIMPLLKAYMLLFQSNEPLAHQLHHNQENIFRNSLTCYVKPDHFVDAKRQSLSGQKLKQLNLHDREILLSKPFVGDKCDSIMQDDAKEHSVVVAFREKMEKAYIA